MFCVGEDNYRVTAWRPHIDRLHGELHYAINCIVFESTGSVALFLNGIEILEDFAGITYALSTITLRTL